MKNPDDPMIVKPHGFAHEHFVVLPERARRDASKHPLLRGLYVTDAGHFPRAAGHRIWRAAGSETHLLMVCHRGKGWVRGPESEPALPVSAGDVIRVPAGCPHAYGSDDLRPWTLTYAHFAGGEAEIWMRHAGWTGKGPQRLRFPAGRISELRMDRVYAILEKGDDPGRQIEAAAALRYALAVLGRLVAEAGPARSARERTGAVRERLRSEPARRWTLDELAAQAGLSVPRFAQVFREISGTSPIDYLQRVRIQHACRRLLSSDESIANIASGVGYDDAFYFARCFRKVMGLSPRDYRAGASGVEKRF